MGEWWRGGNVWVVGLEGIGIEGNSSGLWLCSRRARSLRWLRFSVCDRILLAGFAIFPMARELSAAAAAAAESEIPPSSHFCCGDDLRG